MRYNIFILFMLLTGCLKEDICVDKYEYAIVKEIQPISKFMVILLLQKGNDPNLLICEVTRFYVDEKLIEGPLYGKKL